MRASWAFRAGCVVKSWLSSEEEARVEGEVQAEGCGSDA